MSSEVLGSGSEVCYIPHGPRLGADEVPPSEVTVNGMPATGELRTILQQAQAEARRRDALVVAGLLMGEQ